VVNHLPGPRPLLLASARAALLGRLGRLTIADVQALDAAVRALREERPYRKRVDMGFWLAWYEGPHLTGAEGRELEGLFGEVVLAMAHGLTGLDAGRIAPRPVDRYEAGFLADAARLFQHVSPDQSRQDAAIGLIERAVAPLDPRLAIVACWNAACAATLRPHLAAGVVGVLEVAWRTALGELPA